MSEMLALKSIVWIGTFKGLFKVKFCQHYRILHSDRLEGDRLHLVAHNYLDSNSVSSALLAVNFMGIESLESNDTVSNVILVKLDHLEGPLSDSLDLTGNRLVEALELLLLLDELAGVFLLFSSQVLRVLIEFSCVLFLLTLFYKDSFEVQIAAEIDLVHVAESVFLVLLLDSALELYFVAWGFHSSFLDLIF
jgi:hypothetical protein